MEEYKVIARKWRPGRFSDVVGQEHVVQTLRNAITQKRTAHAYLFVGPRGIGKTTTARIFAKALNCVSPIDGEPCCKCDSCLRTANESNIDVTEIDAASQNSVDNIRDLRDEVAHIPVNSKYKIYIIDEVHMLSKAAWNALLKTVEEPPPHVKFIFATTEVHMVLPTIISRCQRFDLQRISTKLIQDRLRYIADQEKVSISDNALSAIARAADGGMRDAQSLLDQMISFFSGRSDSEEISEDKVLSLFGLTASGELDLLMKAVFTNSPRDVITGIFDLAAKGKNLETLFADILSNLRNIQICQLVDDPAMILEIGEEAIERCRYFASNVKPRTVQLLLESLSPVGRVLHDALNKQIFLESILLKAMRNAHAVCAEDIINRLNVLRKGGELAAVEQLKAQDRDLTLPESAKSQQVIAANAVEKPVSVQKKSVEQTAAPVLESEVQIEQVVEPQTAKQTSGADDEQQKPLAEEVKTAVKTVEVVEIKQDTPTSLWHRVVAAAENSGEFNLAIVNLMRDGVAESWENSALQIRFAGEYEQTCVQPMLDAKSALQKILIDICGDWTASLTFDLQIKELSVPQEAIDCVEPQNIEPQGEASVSQVSESKAGYNNVTNSLLSTIPDLEDIELVDDEDILALDELAAVIQSEPELSEELLEQQQNQAELRKKVAGNPLVGQILEVFNGEIVDVHA